MARWGEGDPRWVVTDREDGSNVNGWHWEEKDRMAWTRTRVGELLTGLAANTAPLQAQLTVSKVSKITGEASVSQRKGGKKLAVFDLVLEMEWVGQIAGGEGTEVKGLIKITEFASHSDADEYMLDCTKTTGSGSDAKKREACGALCVSVHEDRAAAVRSACKQPHGLDRLAIWFTEQMWRLAKDKLQPAVLQALECYAAELLATL